MDQTERSKSALTVILRPIQHGIIYMPNLSAWLQPESVDVVLCRMEEVRARIGPSKLS